jgi:hypothetical protein
MSSEKRNKMDQVDTNDLRSSFIPSTTKWDKATLPISNRTNGDIDRFPGLPQGNLLPAMEDRITTPTARGMRWYPLSLLKQPRKSKLSASVGSKIRRISPTKPRHGVISSAMT